MNVKAFLGFLFFILVTIALFVFAISLTRDSTNGEPKANLTEHINATSTVTHTVRGRIIANEDHNSYRVTISQSKRKVEVLSGYDHRVIATKEYSNTVKAYEEFVYALNRTDFSKVYGTDLRGICATGRLTTYVFSDLNTDSNEREDIASEWSTSCGSASSKKFNTAYLFESQIPDFNEIISEVSY